MEAGDDSLPAASSSLLRRLCEIPGAGREKSIVAVRSLAIASKFPAFLAPQWEIHPSNTRAFFRWVVRAAALATTYRGPSYRTIPGRKPESSLPAGSGTGTQAVSLIVPPAAPYK